MLEQKTRNPCLQLTSCSSMCVSVIVAILKSQVQSKVLEVIWSIWQLGYKGINLEMQKYSPTSCLFDYQSLEAPCFSPPTCSTMRSLQQAPVWGGLSHLLQRQCSPKPCWQLSGSWGAFFNIIARTLVFRSFEFVFLGVVRTEDMVKGFSNAKHLLFYWGEAPAHKT